MKIKNKVKKVLCCLIALVSLLFPFSASAAQSYSDFAVANVAFSVISSEPAYELHWVSTPNSFEVVKVKKYLSDMSAKQISDANNYFDSLSTNNIRISTATARYNCHSYAWYSQNITTNEYWMPDPSLYYTDGSYYEVSSPRKGDIICYFDEKDNDNANDDENLHSGIVVSVVSSFPNGLCGSANTVLVISKWGSAGLYIHNGYTCPYTADYSGDATTVRYYRKANHTHTYSNTQITDSTLSIKFHSSACHGVGCGQEIYAPHNWVEVRINPSSVSPQYVPGYQCSDCGYFTLQNPES